MQMKNYKFSISYIRRNWLRDTGSGQLCVICIGLTCIGYQLYEVTTVTSLVLVSSIELTLIITPLSPCSYW